jgi:hypothetical protein
MHPMLKIRDPKDYLVYRAKLENEKEQKMVQIAELEMLKEQSGVEK